MINLNKKDSLSVAVSDVLQQEALKGNQKKIDKNHNNKIDADDFKILRGEKKPEVKEEIDVKDRTSDTLAGRVKTDKKDDVGPASNFKSTKVRFHAGPDNSDDSVETVTPDANKALQNKTKLRMGEETEQLDEKNWIAGAIKKPGAMTAAAKREGKSTSEYIKSHEHEGGKAGHRARLAKTLKSFKEENEEHSIYDQMIQEVLSKDASAGDWIHDFVHSDNPKFAGKSKEMRKKMALAAYYAKQRNEEVESDICPECMQDPCVCGGNHIEEEVEQINELSPKTVASYTDKSYKDYSQRLKASAAAKTYDPKTSKRWKGLIGAAKRGPKTHQVPAGKDAVDRSGRAYWGEDVEQIDESELKTKTAYVPYVYTDRHGSGFGGYDVHYSKEADAHAHVARHGHTDVNGKKGWVEKHEIVKHPATGRWVDANHLRRHGTGMNEETEQVEEGWDDMLKAAKERSGPQPSGGSGVKKGRAYGGAAQKSKPEQDEPEDKKKVTESKRPETDNVPFEGPYNPTSKPVDVTDKSGAHHTPMSRVKHLARQAMKKMKSEMLGKAGTSESKKWK